ncbi:GyrI-like domain-containing protein [Dysgonomonas sp. ZJ709]|uniref:GyrI-like domain-containing protein n=1 Tax=Dysgonomonas sp. ZJ709 TaxID=2709797 RepID=UPI0013ECC00A|nr:GyrI-like domain-containing protein [Dysgonomonas sp. ZJ709]
MKEPICQSCGMSMAAIEHFGTNSNNSRSDDYCCFCFQKGKFTDDKSLDETIEDSISYFDDYQKIDGRFITKDEVALKERMKISALKRWASHENTHQEYYKSVNRVVDYINDQLASSINLSDLAGVAHLSDFHFHRIFKAIMNESPGDYIQRLRLEKTSFILQTTKQPLSEIAEQIGYQSPHALSKAFKKRFGISPSVFRKRPAELSVAIREPLENLLLHPEIREIKSQEVVYTRIIDPFNFSDAYTKAWDKLINYLNISGIPNEDYQYLCLSRDISTITNPEHIRMYACISTAKKIKTSGHFGVQTIEGGLYAVFKYKGAYDKLEIVYCNIYRYWIPQSAFQLRDNMSFEKYLNSPNQVEKDDLLTEVYIPVVPI